MLEITRENLRRYGLVLAMMAGATALWCLLTPITRYYFGYVYLLIIVLASGKYLGYGPSFFALLLGGIPAVGMRVFITNKGFDDSFFLAFIAYYIIGTIFILLYRKQQIAFFALQREVEHRKAVEEVIRTSEARLQGILDNTTALVQLKDADGRFLLINRRWKELFDIDARQVVGRTARDLFPDEIVDAWEANDRKVIDTGEPIRVEEVVPHGDGEHIYLSVKFPIKDAFGSVVSVGGISTDLTDQKQALAAIEAEQEMLRHTLEVQDHERQLVAYEIHDGLLQHAAGALMQIQGVRCEVDDQAIANRLGAVALGLSKAVDEGRRLINGIRTPVLDDWGVVAAVTQLIEDEERAHVRIEFVNDGEVGRMAPLVEEALYRITQEALTNVHKHSRCERARVALGQRDGQVTLEVRDWGIGFAPTNGSTRVHGLRGMCERARIAGGHCTIQSTPGAGTKILVEVPYQVRA